MTLGNSRANLLRIKLGLHLLLLNMFGLLLECLHILYLYLSKHVVRNISRFRLRAHTLRVESGLWQNIVFSCNRCDCQDIQDEKHVLFYCKDACVCALKQKYAFLFDGLFATLQAFANECRPYLIMFHRVSNQEKAHRVNKRANHHGWATGNKHASPRLRTSTSREPKTANDN